MLVCGTLVYTKGDEDEAAVELPLLQSTVGTEAGGTPPPEPAAAEPLHAAAAGAAGPRMPTVSVSRLAASASAQPVGMALSLKARPVEKLALLAGQWSLPVQDRGLRLVRGRWILACKVYPGRGMLSACPGNPAVPPSRHGPGWRVACHLGVC